MLTDTDWELLNAYADGELDGAAAAAFKKRLAREPALAAELERVRSLKAVLSGLRPKTSTVRVRRPLWARVGAVAASVLVAAGLSFGGYQLLAPQADPSAFEGLHQGFAAKSYVIEHDGAIVLSSGTLIGAFQAPDLTASNLRLVDIRVVGDAETERVAMHYRGPRGCRVTLVAAPIAGAPPQNSQRMELYRQWSTRAARFVLMADGMDPNRFGAIAAYAEAASRALPAVGDLRVALVEKTASARPCV